MEAPSNPLSPLRRILVCLAVVACAVVAIVWLIPSGESRDPHRDQAPAVSPAKENGDGQKQNDKGDQAAPEELAAVYKKLSPEERKVVDSLISQAFDGIKKLESARLQYFWRSRTEQNVVALYVLLPAPTAEDISAMTDLLQSKLKHSDPSLSKVLRLIRERMYAKGTLFPRKYRLIRMVRFPDGPLQCSEDHIENPGNLVKNDNGTVTIREATGYLPHIDEGLFAGDARYDYLLKYIDTAKDVPIPEEHPRFLIK